MIFFRFLFAVARSRSREYPPPGPLRYLNFRDVLVLRYERTMEWQATLRPKQIASSIVFVLVHTESLVRMPQIHSVVNMGTPRAFALALGQKIFCMYDGFLN